MPESSILKDFKKLLGAENVLVRDKALAELKADGTIQSIIDKYIPSK